ncbi:MAG TPA: DUF6378 domain-containing protein [Rhizobium sp.]|nr:DUF6378 domain-containing protein [Rhizobium sp.]
MHRADMLRKAASLTTGDRNKTYGHPFDNMQAAADLITAYLKNKYAEVLGQSNFAVTAEDAAHFMTLLKMVRTMQGKFHADNYIDSACYEAIAGECRFIDESDERPAEHPLAAVRPDLIQERGPLRTSDFYHGPIPPKEDRT